MWSRQQLDQHEHAAHLLTTIMRDAFAHLSGRIGISEKDVQVYITQRMKVAGLVMDAPFNNPIVAFGAHAAFPHYFPGPRPARLQHNTFVLIDIWGRLRQARAPYADITWVGFFGKKVPSEVRRVVATVFSARDRSLRFIERQLRRGVLPSGQAADAAASDHLVSAGYAHGILHRTGHLLGTVSPHGRGRHLNTKNGHSLLPQMGYTIEPGVYLKGKFGVRSEINFFISRNHKLVVTTPPQRQLLKI